jgi:predicted Zn-dependent peptidase
LLERHQLDNGLKVIVVPDHSNPLVALAVVYDIGFRSEPEARTGFAHLFEHMMFQGSEHVGKVEHIQLVESAGGIMNGHTMPDLTAYYEALPSSALELALWLEADRMGSLAVNEENLRNQVAVVEEEIKVNVLNQPYGGFPWILLPSVAFDTFPNSHNGYGDFAHLEDATVEEATDFYRDYYAPSNAVLAVVGDCRPDEAIGLVERHFGGFAHRTTPFHGPWPEPRPTAERRRTFPDSLAPQPAFAVGYRTPDPVKALDDYASYVVLAKVLAGGDASRLRTRLMHRDHIVTDVSCMLGTFGDDAFLMRDPVLFQIVVFHPGVETTERLTNAIDEELERISEDGPTSDEMERVRASSAADHWHGLDSLLNRALTLASVETIHRRAELIEELPSVLGGVEQNDVMRAASDLLSQFRSVVELESELGKRPSR